MRDLKFVFGLLIISILILVELNFIIYPASASLQYLNQGDIVYINDTIDISGVVPPYPQLAYWDGRDMYDSAPTYNITLPVQHSAYYNFKIDPDIFSSRLGNWYKYNNVFEPRGNNLAFVVKPQSFKNSTLTFSNGTIIANSLLLNNTYSTTTTPFVPPVPVRHISDYLVARGDSLIVPVNETTNIWIFGRIDKLFDYQSVDQSIDITAKTLSGFEAGRYTIVTQTKKEGSNDFTVKYDPIDNSIKWFDPEQFEINSISMIGLSPQVMLDKFYHLLPSLSDNFKTYALEFQEPSIEITSVEEQLIPNETVDLAGRTEYYTNISYINVKGYTNVAPDTAMKFIIDEDKQTVRSINMFTSTATSSGSLGGDMRWFSVIIPVDKYNLAKGQHSVTGYTALSKTGTTATFYIYGAGENSYVPPKEIRYISGRYGPEEIVPTPTPVVQEVIKEVPVTVTITIPVTPSNEQVYAQQQKSQWDIVWTITTWIIGATVTVIIIWWAISLYMRRKEFE